MIAHSLDLKRFCKEDCYVWPTLAAEYTIRVEDTMDPLLTAPRQAALLSVAVSVLTTRINLSSTNRSLSSVAYIYFSFAQRKSSTGVVCC